MTKQTKSCNLANFWATEKLSTNLENSSQGQVYCCDKMYFLARLGNMFVKFLRNVTILTMKYCKLIRKMSGAVPWTYNFTQKMSFKWNCLMIQKTPKTFPSKICVSDKNCKRMESVQNIQNIKKIIAWLFFVLQ